MYGFNNTSIPVAMIIIGALLGSVSGLVLSKFYIKSLAKIFARKSNAFVSWLLPTLLAGVCGVLSTTFIHAILSIIFVIGSEKSLTQHMDGFWSVAVGFAEIIGAAVGLAAGALCTSLHMWKEFCKKETAVEEHTK